MAAALRRSFFLARISSHQLLGLKSVRCLGVSSYYNTKIKNRQASTKMPNIAVIGAGIVGLTTASLIKKNVPGAQVNVLADAFMEDTVSFGAGGIFRPVVDKFPQVPLQTLRRWVASSWDHYSSLAHSADSGEAGVQFISGYQMFNQAKEDPLYKDFVYNFRHMTEKEMAMFPGPRYNYGWFMTTLLTEGRVYLQYISKKCQNSGVSMQKIKINDLTELVGKYDLVVNCAGLGNFDLVKDKTMSPVRGHLIKVEAPFMKHFVYAGDGIDCYILPCLTAVALGGSWEKGDYDTTPRPQDSEAIYNRACTVLPSLRKAKILAEWVGLRPYREAGPRIEKEVLTTPTGSLKVVHNYGHGAEGITLSWPTSLDAVKLVQEMLGDSLQSRL